MRTGFDYILLIVSAACLGFKSTLAKISNGYFDENHNIYTYNFFAFLIAFIVTVIIGFKSIFPINAFTVVMALVFAIAIVVAQVMFIKATKYGDVALSSFVYSCGFLIPTVASVFIFDESISFIQVVGIVLIIISFAITVKADRKRNVKWFFCSITAMIGNGCAMLVQKGFRNSYCAEQFNALLAISFLAAAIVMFVIMPKSHILPSKKFMEAALGAGISLGVNTSINLYLSGVLPGVIVFSCINCVGVIFAAVLARVMVKEKITLKKKIGIAIGIIAICLMNM